MKKILIFLALLIGLMWSVTFILLPKIENKIDELTPVSSSGSDLVTIDQEDSVVKELSQEATSKDIVRQKIETIRKRLALKWLIIEWDSYYRDGQLPLALKKYLDFYKLNPNDSLIIQKLGDTYFEMKKFQGAYNYYSKIADPSKNLQDRIMLSLMLTTKLDNNDSVLDTKKQLSDLWFSSQEEFYYQNSLMCIDDFHLCKKDFWNYFWPAESSENDSWTGSINPKIEYVKLDRVKSAIVNYQNFQVDDVYLKDAYIIGAWYTNGFYNLSAHMWEKLLESKINYKPILKIVAQSYYELWEYEQARTTLLTYYEIDDEDPWVAYLLWIINSKLREYVLANIYLTKAMDLWYSNQSDIHRKLIHNFYLLKNDDSMLDSFDALIKTGDFTQNDLSLWIYYHIIHDKYEQALEWSEKGISLFTTDTPVFHTYKWWILTEQWELELGRSILQEWYELDWEDPFVLINFWYNALARWNKWEALIYFKKIVTLSPESEFAKNAGEEIEKLSNN